ncbi:tetratricopeptide repeat protein [Kitasatospora sp. NPDC004240]
MTADEDAPGHVEQHASASGHARVHQAGRDLHITYVSAEHPFLPRAGRIESVGLPLTPPVALAGLPPDPGLFVGRSRLVHDLLEDIRPRKAPPAPQDRYRSSFLRWRRAVDDWAADHRTVVALTGPPGCGKTALALRVGREAEGRRWYSHQLYLDLRSHEQSEPAGDAPQGSRPRTDTSGALAALLHALGVPFRDMPDGEWERTVHYRGRIRELARQGHPVLLVLDNAAHYGQVEALLPPHPRNCALIVGRQRLAGAALTGARQHEVTALDEAEALAFLRLALTRARPGDPRADEPDDLRALARACDHLPLALDLAAAELVLDPRLPPRTLLERLGGSSGPLDLAVPGAGAGTAVRAAFDLSYTRLPPAQARLFRLASLHPGPHLHAVEAAALTALPQADADTALEALAAAHLLAEAGPRHGRYRYHDLLRRYARERTRDEDTDQVRRQAVRRLLGHYVRAAAQADARLGGGSASGAGDLFPDLRHALAWLDAERPALVGAVRLAAASGFAAEAAALALHLTVYLDRRKLWDDWTVTHELASECARRAGDHASEGALLRHLGRAHAQRRRFDDALRHYRRSQAAYAAADDTDGVRVVLGQVLRVLQDTEGAGGPADETVRRYEQVAGMFREGGDRAAFAVVLTNLGNLHLNGGAHARAAACHAEALKVRRALDDVRGTAQSVVNLGTVAHRDGHPEQAAVHYRLAHDLFQRIDDHYGRAQALENLGLAELAAGRVGEGRKAWRAAAGLFAAEGHRTEAARLTEAVRALGRLRRSRVAVDRLVRRTTLTYGDRLPEIEATDGNGPASSGPDGASAEQGGPAEQGGAGQAGYFDATAHPDNEAAVIEPGHGEPVPDHGVDYGVDQHPGDYDDAGYGSDGNDDGYDYDDD